MVIKGPVAMAGSILNRSRVKGTRVPKMEAKITTANKESDTDTVVAILSRKTSCKRIRVGISCRR